MFPTFDDAAKARVTTLAKAIHAGGLGRWKAQRIKNLLKHVKRRYGKYSITSLRSLDDKDMEQRLCELDGIGIKSARCIMMYSFQRDVFPIDVHCARVLRRIGLKFPSASPRSKKFADEIQAAIPAKRRYSFHINLVQHGRQLCGTKPRCDACPISRICITGKKRNAKV